ALPASARARNTERRLAWPASIKATFMSVQHALRGRDGVGRAWIDFGRRPKRARQSLEADLYDVVQVGARVLDHVKVDLRAACQRLEEDLGELRVEASDARFRHVDLPDEVGASGEIQGAADTRFIHDEGRAAVASDAFPVPEGLLESLAEHDADILGRVVAVDLDVAPCSDGQVEEPM